MNTKFYLCLKRTIKTICEIHSATLEYLLVDGEQSTDVAFTNLNSCKKLKVFHVSFAKLLNKTTLGKIAELINLESLTLRHTNIKEPGAFKYLFETGYFPKMKILHLEKCDSLNDDALTRIPTWYFSIFN